MTLNATNRCRCPALSVFHIRINPCAVFFVKYIIEAYDNLYQITTLDIDSGLVEIKSAAGMEEEIETLMESVSRHTGLDCISRIS